MPSAPSAPDPNLIAQLANYFFRTPPDGPIPTQDSPGMPLVPPSPKMAPAPSVVTSAAPLIPAALPFGPPDLPPTTIASVVPTPNISAPTTPAAPHGLPDVPQPGSTAGGFAPNAPGDLDAAGPLAHLAEFTSFVPKEHLASAFGAQDLTPSPFNTPPKDSPYFLDDNALARRDLDLAAVPAAPTPSVAPALPDAAPAARPPDAPGNPRRSRRGLTRLSRAQGRPRRSFRKALVGRAPPFRKRRRRRSISRTCRMAPAFPMRMCRAKRFISSARPSPPQRAETAPQNGATAPAAPVQAPASFSPQIVALETAPAAVDLGSSTRPFDAYTVKRDFPILQEKVHGKPLVWLDNAATTQKPQSVIDRISYFYEHENSNIHRAAHDLAARATDAYEARGRRRALSQRGLRARHHLRPRRDRGYQPRRQSLGWRNVKEGDEIVITWLEHHANIVPWQQLCGATGAKLRVAPVDNTGQVILEEYERLLGPRTRIVAIPQVSNALGTIVPVKEMTAIAHRYGACVLVDGAQSVSHMPVDVQAIDCDFFVFSGHKVFGPTGIGVVYGKPDVLAHMPPWQGGGNMIADVTFEKTIYQPPPNRFEAGTGNIADAVGLGAAIDYVESIGREIIDRYEHELLVYATEKMLTVPGLTMIGTAKDKASVLSFVLDGAAARMSARR